MHRTSAAFLSLTLDVLELPAACAVEQYQDVYKAHLPQAFHFFLKSIFLGSQECRHAALSIHTVCECRNLLQQLARADLLCHGCQTILSHLCF